MLMILASAIGIILALAFDFYLPPAFSPYIAIIILASIDSILGAYTALTEKNFNLTIFITGLFGNSLISAFLIFIGKRLGVDLYLAAVIVFMIRIFKNFAVVRRYILKAFIEKNQDNINNEKIEQEIK